MKLMSQVLGYLRGTSYLETQSADRLMEIIELCTARQMNPCALNNEKAPDHVHRRDEAVHFDDLTYEGYPLK